MTISKRKVLVTGATRQIGGELIRLLANDGSLEIVAAEKRNPPGCALGLSHPWTTQRRQRQRRADSFLVPGRMTR
jgi:NAD(P)-dependent dehydrogenase (short-subunit alcohol dehydrogenase family)